MGKGALQAIDDNVRHYGLTYHDADYHLRAMYQYFEDTGHPYNEADDWAVLYHDIVFDPEPNKEVRSAQLFARDALLTRLSSDLVSDVVIRIIATIDHSNVIGAGLSPIIRADCHQLADPVTAAINYRLILMESKNLYGITVKEFAAVNLMFMNGLMSRIAINHLADPENAPLYASIIEGIQLTMQMSEQILEKPE